MPIVLLPSIVLADGKEPVRRGVRNGAMPPAPAFTELAYLVNQVLAKRKKVVFHKWINEADAYETVTSADTWRFYFRAGANVNKVRCRMVLAPVEDTEGNAPDPRIFWTTDDGATATAQTTVRYNVRKTAPYTVVPDDWVTVTQDWTAISANTEYRATLTQVDKLRVLGCTVWEIPDFAYDTSADVVVNPKGIIANQGIFDRDLNDLVATLTTLWKQQGTHFFNWTRPSTTAITTINTAYVNVVDTSTTAWAANSEGFYTYPQYHGALETVTAGNRETVPIVFWAFMQISDAAQTVSVALVDQNNTTAAPIATLTRTGAVTAAFVTGTANWSAPSNAAMKLDVYVKTSNASATASCFAAGAFMYSA